MATIGNIVVNMGLDRRGFSAGLGKARDGLSGLVGYAKRVPSMVGGLVTAGITAMAAAAAAGAAAAGAALATISSHVNEAMTSIDAMAKKSDRLGIATEHLGGLRHAASLAGAETEDLDEFLKNMNEKVGLVRFGDAGATEQFEKLGIAARDLEGLNTVDTFKLIADRMASIEDPTKRVAAGLELFGEEGNKLMGLMSQGSGAVGEMMQEAEDLGIAVNRVDAAKIEAANDAYTRMQGMIQGIWNKLAVQVAPILEFVIEKMVAWGREGNNAGGWITSGVDMVIDGIGFLGDYIVFLQGYWEGLGGIATKALAWIVSGISKVADGLSTVAGLLGMDVDTSWLSSMAEELHRGADQSLSKAKQLMGDGLAGKFSEQFSANVAKAVQDANKAAEEAASKSQSGPVGIDEMLNKTRELEQAAKSVFDSTRTPMEKFKEEAAKLQEMFAGGFINEETYQRALAAARPVDKQLEDLKKKAESLRESTATPLEKFREEASGVYDMFNRGLINQDELERGLSAARKNVVGEQEQDDTDRRGKILDNKAITRGSEEAFQLAIRAGLGLNKDNAEAKQLRKMDETNKNLGEMRSILAEIKRGGGGLQVASIN